MPLNPPYPFIAFDLDGTLSDSSAGILAAYREAFGTALDDHYLRNCIGTPLRDTIDRHIAAADEREAAWNRFHRYYEQQGWLESDCYPGIPELLRDLNHAGCHLAVVTNKQEHYARRMIRQQGLEEHFGHIAGLKHDILSKTALLENWLEQTAHAPGHCVMIGDSKADVDAALANGIPAIWVSYGYGSISEIDRTQLAGTAGSVAALRKLLLPDA